GSAAQHHSASKTRVDALMVLRCARETKRITLAGKLVLAPESQVRMPRVPHAVQRAAPHRRCGTPVITVFAQTVGRAIGSSMAAGRSCILWTRFKSGDPAEIS